MWSVLQKSHPILLSNPAEQPAAEEDGHDGHDDFGRLSVCDDDIAGSENK